MIKAILLPHHILSHIYSAHPSHFYHTVFISGHEDEEMIKQPCRIFPYYKNGSEKLELS